MTAPTTRTVSYAASLMHKRWQRLELSVRCALEPDHPARIGQFFGAALRLVGDGVLPPVPTFERVLQVLLNTAQDAALPWHWRCNCIEHACRPLARLTTLARGDPMLAQRVAAWAAALAAAEVGHPPNQPHQQQRA